MRAIKFRGKCCHCDEWAYGNLVDYGEDEYPEIQGFDVFAEGIDEWKEVSVERDTIGQYTGLSDNKGRFIFEGDVVRHKDRNYSVDFFNGAFCLVDDLGVVHEDVASMMRSSTIVGNIHDNHDLTKFVMRCDR